jgi:two-component system CheB/CheR fusion protein
VVKDLREMCIFSQHSVIKDAPFSRLDLLSCRNLLIYLDAEVQNRVIPLFHFALRPGGYLFLGNSENISRYTNLFKPVESRSRIFKRLETAAGILPDFPFTTVERRVVDSGFRMARPRAVAGSLELRALRIADQHAPAYVITDQDFGVLHFSGRTGRFLEPADGAANLNLLNLVHPDLRLDLRGALARVIQQKEGVRISSVPMGRDGDRRVLDLVVEPIQDGSGPPDNFVVLFKEAGERPNGGAVDGIGDPEDNRIQRLEAELRTASGRLQATVEELETTNEELKSSNEEYQSLNEELQSANEELETSKEELQSINEELTTVNGELAHRVQELAHTNSDLKNLLESTQIATVFLDNNFRVTRFTPAVTEVFHLIETDIGRPISHIKSRLSYDELQDDVTRVLRTLSSVDREVENPVTGTRYMVRVLPYRTVDNYIHGAVLTFTDLTPVVEAQTALRESERHARLLLAELQHRVRNTLAVIRSIARRSAVTSESVKDFAKKLDGRISAFARVQTAVTRDPSAGMTLNGLITDELLAVGASIGKRVRKLAGPDVRLHPKAAETLALVVHELATNAVKYGALSIDQGEIDVNWRVQTNDGPGRFILQWREAGVTFATDKPRRRGFGTELIERTIAYDLGGAATLDFGSDGLICTIELPASNKILHQ